LLLPIFGFPNKNEKNTKNIYSEEIQKIIWARKGCWNAENDQKLVEKVQKCKRLKFDSLLLTDESLVDKENSILKKIYSKSDVYGLN